MVMTLLCTTHCSECRPAPDKESNKESNVDQSFFPGTFQQMIRYIASLSFDGGEGEKVSAWKCPLAASPMASRSWTEILTPSSRKGRDTVTQNMGSSPRASAFWPPGALTEEINSSFYFVIITIPITLLLSYTYFKLTFTLLH